MAVSLDSLRERAAALVAQRDQMAARLAALSPAVEHQKRVELFRANLAVTPSTQVRGAVQEIVRTRSKAEADLADLDADIAAISALLVEAEEAERAAVQAERDKAFRALQRQAEASWRAVFERFNGLHSDWVQLAADIDRVAEAWYRFPDRDQVNPFPHSVIPGDLMMLCKILIDHSVRRGQQITVPWFEAQMDELPEVEVSAPGGLDVRRSR